MPHEVGINGARSDQMGVTMDHQVPAVAQWPPDRFQLAHLASETHWVLEQVAWNLAAGTATREQLDEVARALEGLAPLLRTHVLDSERTAPE